MKRKSNLFSLSLLNARRDDRAWKESAFREKSRWRIAGNYALWREKNKFHVQSKKKAERKKIQLQLDNPIRPSSGTCVSGTNQATTFAAYLIETKKYVYLIFEVSSAKAGERMWFGLAHNEEIEEEKTYSICNLGLSTKPNFSLFCTAQVCPSHVRRRPGLSQFYFPLTKHRTKADWALNPILCRAFTRKRLTCEEILGRLWKERFLWILHKAITIRYVFLGLTTRFSVINLQ